MQAVARAHRDYADYGALFNSMLKNEADRGFSSKPELRQSRSRTFPSSDFESPRRQCQRQRRLLILDFLGAQMSRSWSLVSVGRNLNAMETHGRSQMSSEVR